jgi:hypothetical protein
MGPVTRKIQSHYFDVIRGKQPKYKEWLTSYEVSNASIKPRKALRAQAP